MRTLFLTLALLLFCHYSPNAQTVDLSTPVGDSLRRDELTKLLAKGWDLYSKKQYAEALSVSNTAAAMKPDDYRPHALAGMVYIAQWKMKSGSDALAKAIALSPRSKGLYLYKSKADRFRNARDEAIAAARKAIELDPDFAEAHVALGEALLIGGKQTAEAAEAFRKAINIDPSLLTAYVQLGNRLAEEGDSRGAEDAFRRAMSMDPTGMSGRFELGRIYVKSGKLKEARALWDGRSSDEDGTFPNFIDLLERAEARKSATENLAKKPNDPDALVEMGLSVMDGDSWVVDGRQERAIVYLKKALRIKPTFAKAQYAICKAWVQVADIDESKNSILERELKKLRRMDVKLADEIVEYRKTYQGGITGVPAPIDQ